MDTKVNWIIHYVFDDPGPYPYLCNAHTHGNSINGMEKYHHLDFQMVLNLPQEHICYLLNTLGRWMQNGESFYNGDMVSGLYEDCSICLKKARETGRDVLRLIIPDKYNRFPEDENCMEPYKHQELDMFEE